MSDRPNSTRITSLDGLRGVAIGLILLHHYVQLHLPSRLGWPQVLDRVLALSWSGVDLFFVLSGFLIGGLLMDHRTSPSLTRVFYLRRGLRILPLYYFTLLVLFAWLSAGSYAHLPAWIYLTFTSNIGIVVRHNWDVGLLAVTWSLAVEEQFYLVAPWVIRWTKPDRLPRVLGTVIAIAWLVRAGARWSDPNGFASHVLMPCRMDSFAFGMLAACATRSTSFRAWITQHVSRAKVAAVLMVLPVLALGCFYHSLADWQVSLYGYTSLGLFYGSLIYLVVALRPGPLVAVLSWSPLVSLGRLSYFIYLWHMILLLSLGRRIMGGNDFPLDSLRAWLAVAACVVTTWALAWVSWRVFEGPLVRLGHRHAY
ncbi:MAG: acyltransferase [Opitutaceae bacterium]